MNLDTFNKNIKQCERCNLGPNKRTLIGYGSTKPDIFIVGESPSVVGTAENIPIFQKKSKPFYDAVLTSLNATVDSIYTSNAVKCSEPLVDVGSINECKQNLLTEIETLNPRLVLVLSSKISRLIFNQKSPSYKKMHRRFYVFYSHPMSSHYKNLEPFDYAHALHPLLEDYNEHVASHSFPSYNKRANTYDKQFTLNKF